MNVANGNLVFSATDAQLTSGDDEAVLDRYYNSSIDAGWRLSVGPYVRLDSLGGGDERYVGPSGDRTIFRQQSDGTYVASTAVAATLSAAASGGYDLVDGQTGDTLHFDAAGVLTTRTTAAGGAFTYAYDGGRVTSISAPDGSQMDFSYDEFGRLSSVSTPGVGTDTYSYDSGGNLASHTSPDGNVETYGYQGGRLSSITDSGSTTSVTYDASGRVASVSPGGSASPSSTYTYAAGSTDVAAQGSPTMTYHWDDNGFIAHAASAGSPPTLDVSGSLKDAAEQTVAPSASLDLSAEAGGSSGVSQITVMVDGDAADDIEQPCAGGCGGLTEDYSVDAQELGEGRHVISVLADNPQGEQRYESFAVTVKPDSTTDDQSDDSELTQDELVAQAERFRQEFGLRSDEPYVQDSFQDPSMDAGIPEYGVPLTSSELTDLEHRLDVQDQLGVVDDYGAAHPDSYAGTYIDQEQGGLVYVGFTSNAQSHLADLEAEFPYPDELRVFDATQTLSQLQGLQGQVTDDIPDLESQGINVAGVGIDVATNNVTVDLTNDSQAAGDEVSAQYGSGVDVSLDNEVEPAARDKKLRPLPGGMYMHSTAKVNGQTWTESCTNAFSARRQTDTLGGKNVYSYYMLTAGHCIGTREPGQDLKDQFHVWEQGGSKIGHMRHSTFTDGSDADGASIALTHSSIASKRVFITPGVYRPIKKTKRATQGEQVCASEGHTGKVLCGKVTDADQNVRYKLDNGGTTLRHQEIATPDSRPGDSGSPMYQPAGRNPITAAGILSGSSTKKNGTESVIFSPIGAVTDKLGVNVYHK